MKLFSHGWTKKKDRREAKTVEAKVRENQSEFTPADYWGNGVLTTDMHNSNRREKTEASTSQQTSLHYLTNSYIVIWSRKSEAMLTRNAFTTTTATTFFFEILLPYQPRLLLLQQGRRV